MASIGPEKRIRPQAAPDLRASDHARAERIPGVFQLVLSLYIILSGDFPTLIQALAFGVQGGASNEFSLAMITGIAISILQFLPLLILGKHPLGVLHPLIIALIIWPVMTHAPEVIQDWGGWIGVFAGSPVKVPAYLGLPGYTAGAVWTAIAKYNALQILSLICIYAGFWALSARPNLSRAAIRMPSPAAVRQMMFAIVVVSLVVLVVFIRYRGGVNEHLTSLGRGRFVELAGLGPILLIASFGAVALYVWVAARPGDIKNPLFLACLAAVTAGQFIGSGTRSGAFEVPLYIGLIWAMRRQRIPWKVALILIPFMLASIGLLGAMRSSMWYGSNADETLSGATWSESMALTQHEIDNRQALSASVPVFERGYKLSGGPLFGYSYAATVTTFVPRAFWPDKPRGVGSLYAQLFQGASFSGTTIPVGPQAEMYWNFGLIGVVLLSLLYGVILRKVYHFHWRHYPSPFAAVFYVLMVTKFQFSSDRLVGLEQQVVLVILCYLAVALFIPPTVGVSAAAGNRNILRKRQPLGIRHP
jgi:oligosaccharide repeat unit polymerase